MDRLKYLILCTGLFFFMACTNDIAENKFLQLATEQVEKNPEQALKMLENIPDPHILSKDEYMYYVVTLTQAKYMNGQDITTNTLILDAQRYFSESSNYFIAAKANYYAANYYYQIQNENKMLESCLESRYFAGLADNNLYKAKTSYWLGTIFYEMDLLDSAKVYYQQALTFYEIEPTDSGTEDRKLRLTNLLGQTCLGLNEMDQAFEHFNNGLEKARQSKNIELEIRFLNALGIISIETKEYEQAKKHFNQALAKKQNTEDISRVLLNYAWLYRTTNQPDSVIFYLDQVKNKIAQIKYPHTRRIVYEELASYYKKEGDFKNFERYKNLENKEILRIQEAKSNEKISATLSKIKEYNNKTETKYFWSLRVLLLTIFILFILISTLWPLIRKYEKEFKNIRSKIFFDGIEQRRFLLYVGRVTTECIRGIQNANETLIKDKLMDIRSQFHNELADQMTKMITKLKNGEKAMSKLTVEDLCLILFMQMGLSDDDFRAFGFENYTNLEIKNRKFEIRSILMHSGLKNQDINRLIIF